MMIQMVHQVCLKTDREEAERLAGELSMLIHAAVDAYLKERGYPDFTWVIDRDKTLQ